MGITLITRTIFPEGKVTVLSAGWVEQPQAAKTQKRKMENRRGIWRLQNYAFSA
jgi:hypothetical protein